jgi:hypothetical protein
MALTRSFNDTVRERAAKDPEFRLLLIEERMAEIMERSRKKLNSAYKDLAK